MAITQAMATSFKVDILDGTFDFSSGTSQVFKTGSVHVVSYARCDYYCVFSGQTKSQAPATVQAAETR